MAASIGSLVSGYGLALYGYLAIYLAGQFFPTADPTAALLDTFAVFALGFALRPIGGVVFGHVGDRLGRRTALATSILLMGGGTTAIGLLGTYDSRGLWAPVLLLICRVVQGISAGGEIIGAVVLVLEHADPGRQGRTASVNQAAGFVGIAGAATTSLVLASILGPARMAEWGWRVPFVTMAPLSLIGLYLRMRTPDTPAFEAVRDTRLDFPLAVALRTTKRGMLIYIGWLMTFMLGANMLFGYMATYLIRVVGLDSVTAFTAVLAAALLIGVGSWIGGLLVDRFPLQRVAAGTVLVIALTILPSFLIVNRGGLAAAVAGQSVVALCVGIGGIVSALLSIAIFPVRVRFTGAAFAHNVGTVLFGGTAPYVATWLVARGGPLAPAWYLLVASVGGLATLKFLPSASPSRETPQQC